MLDGWEVQEGEHPIFKQLHEMPTVFHLFGSQLMGTQTAESDVDFFTLSNYDVYSALRRIGFTRITKLEHYRDQLTESVLLFKDAKIHIAFVTDVELKMRAVELFLAVPTLYPDKKRHNRRQASQIWNLVYELVITHKMT